MDSAQNDENDDNSDDEPATMDWNEQLRSILDNDVRSSSFCVTQRLDHVPALHPKIHLTGLTVNDRISYPLTHHQSMQLEEMVKVACEKRRNNSGSDYDGSVVDKPWEFDASQVTIYEQEKWNEFLNSLVHDMTLQMGVSSPVKAQLLGLALKGPGVSAPDLLDCDFQHGGFGLLEVQLPSYYKGGTMVVSYKDEPNVSTKEHVDESQDAYFATCFFADCELQTETIKEGSRLSLIYQLQLADPTLPIPTAANVWKHREELRQLVQKWEEGTMKGYLLDETYSGDVNDIWFANLATHDAQVVQLLQSAADTEGDSLFVVHLALLEKWESVSISDGSEDHDEILDSSVTVKAVIDADGNIFSDITMLPFDIDWDLLHDAEEVDDIFGDEPYEEVRREGDVHEFTYYRVAVLFWPRAIADSIAFDASTSLKRGAPGSSFIGTRDKRARVEPVNVPGAGRQDDPFVLDDDSD
ncbi:hypothetical protein MPSEU_000701600 [Mayamaea pseudoterrestris]|nr:hypothetical protein MPSEU_000701600 [Mayamaea pseudoterrestris]